MNDKVREELGNMVKVGDTLSIDKPSTCFASVEFEVIDEDGNGIATGTFHRGGSLVYSGPMSIDEFLEWSDSESLGGYYNETKPF